MPSLFRPVHLFLFLYFPLCFSNFFFILLSLPLQSSLHENKVAPLQRPLSIFVSPPFLTLSLSLIQCLSLSLSGMHASLPARRASCLRPPTRRPVVPPYGTPYLLPPWCQSRTIRDERAITRSWNSTVHTSLMQQSDDESRYHVLPFPI